MTFLHGILLLIACYLITLLLICIDKYRFFSGGKIKDYFNPNYYEGSLYSDDFVHCMTLFPFINILFLFLRIIYLIFILIKWILDKIGVLKWYYHFINLNLKQ